MSDSNYFPTDDAAKARLIDMRERAKGLKKRLAALDDALSERALSWRRLTDAHSSDLGETAFKVGEKTLDILRPYPPGLDMRLNRPAMNTVATLPREHFDGESLWTLIADREETRQTLKQVKDRLAQADLTI